MGFEQEWLNKIFPNGLKHPSSSLISGPGGSGKPLAGLGIAYEWLKQKGNVIFIPLQYPETKFLEKSLGELYNIDVDDYSEKVGFIGLDLDIEDLIVQGNRVRANLLKPDIWDQSINKIEKNLEKGDTLIFASALNLLLFSPTHRKELLKKLSEMIKRKKRSYLFTVSTNAYGDLVKEWEDKVENLMFTYMDSDMNLRLKIERLENQNIEKEVFVPLSKEKILQIKKVAESSRKRIIPKISNI
jgi:archaellum biogenesis ATPase FlaH